jgi:leucyl-tRNA synthetase
MSHIMKKYQPKEFEQKWVQKWAKDEVYKTDETGSKPKQYILDMFPYPSGLGLHVGHVEGYTGTDIYARFMRMNGYRVLHPMGWDAFGLPAENYAVKTNVHPKITTDNAIKTFIEQINATGLSYDWERELGTHRSDYYKWTQWLFLLLYKKGLAYRKEALVNWDPVDQTVLANEQVLPDGTAERSGAKVEQRKLTQWFFKITDYAERLLQDLDKLDWPESTKAGQRNWIGKSEGMLFTAPVKDMNLKIQTFSAHFEAFTADTFVVIAPDHKLLPELIKGLPNEKELHKEIQKMIEEQKLTRNQDIKELKGIFTGRYIIDPVGNGELPIWVANYALSDYGTGIVKCSAHDERDFKFAKKYDIKMKATLIPFDKELAEKVKKLEVCFSDFSKGYLIEPVGYESKSARQMRPEIIKYLEANKLATKKISYKLRDWLISRQRFWGAPIPVVYDKEGKAHPVNIDELPVVLPMDVEFKPTGVSPLRDHKEFQKVDESKYGKSAYREADTMDTFVDSSWYFLRFTDVNNDHEFASKEQMNKWGPVDLYMGGAEHTVLHLLYARFFTKVLFDEGYINFDEPFMKLRHQGTILGEDSRKMSKRWGNVINPTDVIAEYGADTLRMYEMFMGPVDAMKAWNTKNIQGLYRFLQRVWGIYHNPTLIDQKQSSEDQKSVIGLYKLIDKVSQDIPEMKFNTSIAAMMEFLNIWEKSPSGLTKDNAKKFLQVLAPFAPFMTEEIWHEIVGEKESIHLSSWPKVDKSLLVENEITIPVQVNGKVRGTVTVPADKADQKTVEELAVKLEKVKPYLEGNEYTVIYVKGKIMSFIVKAA